MMEVVADDNKDNRTIVIPTTVISCDENVVIDNTNRGSGGSSSHDKKGVTIVLDREEEELFDVLVNTALAYERGELRLEEDEEEEGKDNSSDSSVVEVRVAGGWVRDKILGFSTHDVDVALNCFTGVQFAKLVQRYAAKNNLGVSKIGVIAANPAQSKHLETATMTLCGVDVDFCNLRSEEYVDSNSRIPTTMLFGSPKQDSERRDFTINALYYNLRTRSVEDHTQMGYQDLCCHGSSSGSSSSSSSPSAALPPKNILLRTPLDPYVTFLDDPLRVLRAIRFAVRYRCELEESLMAACRLPEIHHALHAKVSRERVGKELEGMLSGNNADPIEALLLCSKCRLAGSVFCLPKGPEENGYQHQQEKTILHTHYLVEHHVTKVHGTIMINDNSDVNNDVNDDSNNTNEQSTLLYQGDDQNLAHLRELGWEESKALLQLLQEAQSYFQNIMKQQQQQKQQQTEDKRQQQEAPPPPPQNKKSKKNKKTPVLSTTDIDARILPLAVFLLPFRNLYYTVDKPINAANTKKKKGNHDNNNIDVNTKEFPVVSFMFREGIKFKNIDVQAITTIMAHVDEMARFLSKIAATATKKNRDEEPQQLLENLCRLEVGLLLRSTKEYWVTTLLLATVLLVRQQQQQQQQASANVASTTTKTTDDEWCWFWFCLSDVFGTIVNDMKLDHCWKTKPLLNGKAVMDILQLKRGGPIISTYLEEQTKWMLLHPNGTPAECEQHLRFFYDQQQLLLQEKKRSGSHSSSGNNDNNNDANNRSNDNTEKQLKHFSKKLHLMEQPT